MLGIEAIAVHIPPGRASNLDLRDTFDVDEAFLVDKIGVLERAVKAPEDNTSDLALAALENLIEQQGLSRGEIEALVVVTQNPDSNLPQVSALVHGRAGLSPTCAAFDLSLGCSGYAYGVSVLQSFLAGNGLSRGVLIQSSQLKPALHEMLLDCGRISHRNTLIPKDIYHVDLNTRLFLSGSLA
ncbi:MAG: hypothetical protein Q8Q28_16690, partial [Pseudomonadota bacterium]|nr:hypothetical protein [Pseudomonadota bacterium]